jgi:hypothetical protein
LISVSLCKMLYWAISIVVSERQSVRTSCGFLPDSESPRMGGGQFFTIAVPLALGELFTNFGTPIPQVGDKNNVSLFLLPYTRRDLIKVVILFCMTFFALTVSEPD